MHDWARTLKDLREKASDDCGLVNEGSDSSDVITEMVIEEPNDQWDCETILCEFCEQLLRDLIHMRSAVQ